MKIIRPVILAGGISKRLSPLTSATRPKQFFKLFKPKTPFQDTILRITNQDVFSAPVILCHASQSDIVKTQMHEIGITAFKTLTEPHRKNTAAAIALVALAYPDDLLMIMPSDHQISDPYAIEDLGRDILDLGLLEKDIACVGVKPRSPHTGYGYIQYTNVIKDALHEVSLFTEKPDKDTAEAFLRDGSFLWNTGIYIAKGDAFIATYKEHAPILYSQIVKNQWEDIDAVSFDVAIMENLTDARVIISNMAWMDIGTWLHYMRYLLNK